MNFRGVLKALALLIVIGFTVPVVVFSAPGIVGGDSSFVVLSGSMEPEIGAGDAVIVDRVPPESISEGDVITFHREGEPIPTTHRVTEVVESGGAITFLTKGDANEDPDPESVSASQVVGRVTVTIPYLGYVVHYADTPLGTVLLLWVPLGLLAITELWSVVSQVGGSGGAPPAESPPELPGATGHADADGSAGTLAITAGDLRLSLAVLVCFALYAGWIAFQSPGSSLRVSVAVAAALTALFAGAVALALRRPVGAGASAVESDPLSVQDGGSASEWAENGGVPSEESSPMPEERSRGESE